MAINFIPRRFYTDACENSTLVSRAFIDASTKPSTKQDWFSDESESENIWQEIEAPMSPRTLSWNDNSIYNVTMKTKRQLGRKSRLTSDEFVSERSYAKGKPYSCGHLSDMVEAERELEAFGFCNPRMLYGLVPNRFVPSLVTFRGKLPVFQNTSEILQSSLLTNTCGPPDVGRIARQFARRAALSKRQETSVQELETRNAENDQNWENAMIVVCPNCGCYSWA